MISIQLLDDALVAVALLVGVAFALSLTILAVAYVTKRGQASPAGIRHDLPPHGGTGRDLPAQPQPGTDHARELVLR